MQRYKIQEGKSIAEMGCRILCRTIRITCRTLCRIGTKKAGKKPALLSKNYSLSIR